MSAPKIDLDFCECGRYRPARRICCVRCEELDGVMVNGRSNQRLALFEVLQILRSADHGMSTSEIAAELGRQPNDAGLGRMLKRLVRQGRAKLAARDDAERHANYFILRT